MLCNIIYIQSSIIQGIGSWPSSEIWLHQYGVLRISPYLFFSNVCSPRLSCLFDWSVTNETPPQPTTSKYFHGTGSHWPPTKGGTPIKHNYSVLRTPCTYVPKTTGENVVVSKRSINRSQLLGLKFVIECAYPNCRKSSKFQKAVLSCAKDHFG
jgi:hypothetical protein